jgi:hypothetical protein
MKDASPVQGLFQERVHKACDVSVLESGKRIHPLCYDHHIEMRFTLVLLKTEKELTQIIAYVCPVAGCPVHYNTSYGYFIPMQNENEIERDMTPRVACSQDGVRMFLAEVRPTHRSFRLWRCPHCDASHSNQEHLLSDNGTSVEAPMVGTTSLPTSQ